jgi:hypothetical protein
MIPVNINKWRLRISDCGLSKRPRDPHDEGYQEANANQPKVKEDHPNRFVLESKSQQSHRHTPDVFPCDLAPSRDY